MKHGMIKQITLPPFLPLLRRPYFGSILVIMACHDTSWSQLWPVQSYVLLGLHTSTDRVARLQRHACQQLLPAAFAPVLEHLPATNILHALNILYHTILTRNRGCNYTTCKLVAETIMHSMLRLACKELYPVICNDSYH
jgi:hypothetical protein